MWVEVFLDKTVVVSRIPPDSVEGEPCCCQISSVDSDDCGREGILTNQRCRERYETDSQKEDDVDPEEDPIGLFDVMELVVVSDPV